MAALLTGCGASQDITAQVEKLNSELVSLRAQTAALTDRLEAVESKRPSAAEPVAYEAPSRASDPRPDLRVVRLGPGQTAPSDEGAYDSDAQAGPTGRVKIRSTASGLVQEDVSGDDAASSADIKKVSPKKDEKKKDDKKKDDKKKDDAPKSDAPKPDAKKSDANTDKSSPYP
jgi:hypothetical protein